MTDAPEHIHYCTQNECAVLDDIADCDVKYIRADLAIKKAQDYIDIIAAMEIKLERADRVMTAAFELADGVKSVDQYLTKLQTPGSEPLNSVNAAATRKERGKWTAEVRNDAREQWAALGSAIHKFNEAAK